jgi:hypothetical protein
MSLSERFEIVKLEERIAPAGVPCPIPANDNALPPNNEGTANAVDHIRDAPEQAAVALQNWFGKAAC